MTAEATLYAPGQSAGVPCTVGFQGEQLVIQRPGAPTLYLPADALAVEAGGFDDDGLQLQGSLQGQPLTVIVTGMAAQQQLAAGAPASVAPLLQRGRRQMHYHRRKWQVTVGALGALALALLLGWWQSDALTAWLAAKVPLEREQRLGAIWLRQLQADGGLREGGPAVQAVQQLGERITRGSHYQYRWLVKDDPEVNAYAGPGGVVVVYTGLIARTDTPEQLAGVLAHEVQHVEHRHVLQGMIHSAGWAAVLTFALGDVSAITAVLVHQAGNMRHSRQLERVADADGVRALARAGIRADGMVQLLEKVRTEQQQLASGPEIALLSSHPATAERISEVRQLASTVSCDCRPLAMDWAAVKADAETAKILPPAGR